MSLPVPIRLRNCWADTLERSRATNDLGRSPRPSFGKPSFGKNQEIEVKMSFSYADASLASSKQSATRRSSLVERPWLAAAQ